MGLFGSKKGRQIDPELDERLARVERGLRDVQLEWESAYHKLRQVLGRLNKREAVEREREGVATDEVTARLMQRRGRGIR